MRNKFTADDEGKEVLDATGKQVGRIMEVQHGTAHVEPDPGLADSIRSKLGWGEADEDTYQLDGSNIDKVTDDEVHLSR